METILNRPPLITGDDLRFLSIFEGDTSISLDLVASDPDPGDTEKLWWTVQQMASSPLGSSALNCRVRDRIVASVVGPSARVFFSRPGGSATTGRFIVSARDPLDKVDEVRVIARQIANTSPVISRVFGRGVSDVEESTVYISPQVREVTLRVIAIDEFPETLEWTVSGTPMSVATPRFVFSDKAESATRVSGVGEVLVLYQRGPVAGTSSRFVITVADRLDKSDQLVVPWLRMRALRLSSMKGVMTTGEGKTLKVEIPYRSERLTLDLFTSSARTGLVGALVSTPRAETSASFPSFSDEGYVRVELRVSQSLDAASFTIRVANGSADEAASEEIIILVSRQKFIRVRLKMLLGGVVR